MAVLQIGQVIEEFKILGRLGEGGMGVVYQALDTALDRVVAVKTIGADLAHDEFFWERFRREAKALAKLDDPNIVAIFALRETAAGLLMVMEFVDGVTLSRKIKESGPLPVAAVLPMVKQMLAALNHAHQLGIIHRDIKPGNVMLTAKGEVKVTDFGLAKFQRAAEATMTMAPIGTLLYMSPEQAENSKQADARSDLYSLGMTLYEMLAGRTPFGAKSSQLEILQAIFAGGLPSPEKFNAALPRELCRIVMKALATNPAKRFQNAAEMLAAIAKFEAMPPPRRKFFSGKAALFATLLVAALLAILSWLLREDRSSWFNQQEPEKKSGAPEDTSTAKVPPPVSPVRAHSALIQELAMIKDAKTFQEKLGACEETMQLSAGRAEDFAPLDGCYVAVLDETAVRGFFQFKNNAYYAVSSNEKFETLPAQFFGKSLIWVKDFSTP